MFDNHLFNVANMASTPVCLRVLFRGLALFFDDRRSFNGGVGINILYNNFKPPTFTKIEQKSDGHSLMHGYIADVDITVEWIIRVIHVLMVDFLCPAEGVFIASA